MASSPGPPSGPVSPETYWRRRVFLLAGVLVVVALIVWSCSGPSGDGQQAASVNPDASESPESSESASSPSPSPSVSEPPSGDPSSEGGGEGGEGGSGGGSGSGDGEDSGGAGSGGAGGDQKKPEKPEDTCLPKDVVVTFKADDKGYASDEEPKFKVTVVNTEDQTCTVDVGPKALELVITSGNDRIFSTADCVEGDGANKEQLERGVPYTKTIEWHRQRSWKECRDEEADARPGTYVAELKPEYDEAEERVFRLH